MLTRPILTLPNPKHKWRLATDASEVAMGAVLSQIDDDDNEHPIGYYSRKLTQPERKWTIWELELAAAVWATNMCKHYLRTVHFELVTDSKVVSHMIKKEIPKRRENWIVRLFEYDFTITHRKGELNRNADFFSRWAAYKNWKDEQLLTSNKSEIPITHANIMALQIFVAEEIPMSTSPLRRQTLDRRPNRKRCPVSRTQGIRIPRTN